jgi:hypothetical protein
VSVTFATSAALFATSAALFSTVSFNSKTFRHCVSQLATYAGGGAAPQVGDLVGAPNDVRRSVGSAAIRLSKTLSKQLGIPVIHLLTVHRYLFSALQCPALFDATVALIVGG